ncbi:MAG: glycosyltransferase family 2 protein [Chitinophagaceae bacterium]|nr:glycosyltransferase family 2 protein [Chitinophagaceae bacterium]
MIKIAELIFWIAFAVVFYSFIGYGIIIWILVNVKKIFVLAKALDQLFEPEVTLVVPCFNEADIIVEKINNSFMLEYPAGKLNIMFITDGSTDHSAEVLAAYPAIKTLHVSRRGGKTAAENRAMQHVTTPFVIFTDANTLLNKEAVRKMVQHFADDTIGCVAGEKRIITKGADIASAAGEGMYWKYESFLKKLDSQLYSAVGAAGELVAFRTALYEVMPEDTILDDFMQSMYIVSKGYKTIYEPAAYAVETAATSVGEELKRKVRICAGGWQSVQRLNGRLSPAKYPLLYFQYFSHRVLRWTVNPLMLLLMLAANFTLLFSGGMYPIILLLQAVFYVAAFVGYLLQKQHIKLKALFVPYYFCVMNYAVVAGFFRFVKGSQSAVWEKNKRLSAA